MCPKPVNNRIVIATGLPNAPRFIQWDKINKVAKIKFAFDILEISTAFLKQIPLKVNSSSITVGSNNQSPLITYEPSNVELKTTGYPFINAII